MLRICNLEEIQSKLLEVPMLIDLYQARDSSFLNKVLSWFDEVEKVLQRNRLTIVSEIASLRGAIISARRGQSLAQTDPLRRRTKRRAEETAAGQMIRTAVDVITKRIDRDLVLINKAETAMHELVNVGRQLKIIPPDMVVVNPPETLDSLWDKLAGPGGNEVARSYAILIRSNVGLRDALILLDRVLGKWS